MKTLSTLFIAGSLALGGCGSKETQKNNSKDNAQKIKEIDTNSLIKYSLKYIALELSKQEKGLDSLNNHYDSLDKRTDIIRDSLKNITYKKVIEKRSIIVDSLKKCKVLK